MKIEITEKQKQQFNQMLAALQQIKSCHTPEQLEKWCNDRNLVYEEELEEHYVNILDDAHDACKTIEPIADMEWQN